ncbi:MAG: 30S ribosome-binding factor RbfA [Silvanigrellales bacterium]|jgi:ribosome-binding factor A|nr:30S ribosome-binding factor RbfA [Silvanigrellales bacterium]
MANKRILQVGEAIREHLALMLVRGEVSDPRVRNVTLNAVKVSPDLQIARVYYSVLGDESLRAGVAQGLKNAAGYFRRSLGEALGLRYTPHVHFFYDETIERAARMGELFASLDRERSEHALEGVSDVEPRADAEGDDTEAPTSRERRKSE